jgi:hypothetical protein
MRRIRCVLFGCWCDENYACLKCGATLYDPDYVQIGKMDWVSRLWAKICAVPHVVSKRCEVCGKLIWFPGGKSFCSQACWDKWIPF